ncbi:substrate-binding periplasmic protein [Pseudomarimonas arenosa]|uniref:Solute-binding protein family 3/N-terminal domain-containing protein n=1 Tax=Pseudomarimonas arenosa TaxID=2774145 RepID=A0AAW3ZIL1_9GAMM|nr:transporter substrate-binding domain-containing protein [Pseudomarimonas arenosa]MBD8525069.1 hypothetical protein [Pseudomarimonas arenosa]
MQRRSPTHSLALLALLWLTAPAEAVQRVRICVDQADWRPYMWVEAGEVRGLHAEILRTALQSLNLQADFRPMPWIRCQLQAERGDVDAIGPLMYTEVRDKIYFYPKQDSLPDPAQALGENLDVVVTLAALGFEYDGDPQSLPPPVRVPRGWEIAPFLREQGVEVDDGAPNEQAALIKLLREGSGSAVANRLSVELLIEQQDLGEQLHISRQPVRPVPYFLAFSKRSRFTFETRERVWQAIAEQKSRLHRRPSEAQLGGEEPLSGSADQQ